MLCRCCIALAAAHRFLTTSKTCKHVDAFGPGGEAVVVGPGVEAAPAAAVNTSLVSGLDSNHLYVCADGPSRPKYTSCSLQRSLLTPLAKHRSLYRSGESAYEPPVGYGGRKGRPETMRSRSRSRSGGVVG